MTYISWTEIIYRCNLCLCLEYLKIYEYFKKIIRIKNVQKSQFQKKKQRNKQKTEKYIADKCHGNEFAYLPLATLPVFWGPTSPNLSGCWSRSWSAHEVCFGLIPQIEPSVRIVCSAADQPLPSPLCPLLLPLFSAYVSSRLAHFQPHPSHCFILQSRLFLPSPCVHFKLNVHCLAQYSYSSISRPKIWNPLCPVPQTPVGSRLDSKHICSQHKCAHMNKFVHNIL